MKEADQQRANRVIKVFKDTQLNQRQFSELIGVSQQLVSAVVNYTKKPNETILLAIIDNINGIDPMWLFKGSKKNKVNYTPIGVKSPIEETILNIVKKQFDELSFDMIKKLSNMEDAVKNSK